MSYNAAATMNMAAAAYFKAANAYSNPFHHQHHPAVANALIQPGFGYAAGKKTIKSLMFRLVVFETVYLWLVSKSWAQRTIFCIIFSIIRTRHFILLICRFFQVWG